MVVMLVVAIVPIAVGVPAISFDIPPAVAVLPAIPPRFRQVVPGVFRLPALPSMAFYGFMQPVIGFDDPLVAVIGLGAGRQPPQRQATYQHSGSCQQLPASEPVLPMSHDSLPSS
jgi:hypothetical protein